LIESLNGWCVSGSAGDGVGDIGWWQKKIKQKKIRDDGGVKGGGVKGKKIVRRHSHILKQLLGPSYIIEKQQTTNVLILVAATNCLTCLSRVEKRAPKMMKVEPRTPVATPVTADTTTSNNMYS
jgi:hypothetical protein